MRKNPKPFPSETRDPNNFIDNYLEPIWNLPSLEAPPPTPQTVDTETVALIVLFSDAYRRVENLQAWVRAAIYSRGSALKYTDAVKQGVEVKLYIEDVLRPMLTPSLEENFVDVDKDVVWFTPPTIDGVWGYLGKQMCPYWDPQLLTYDRIFVWDADTFFLQRPNTMFERSKSLPLTEIYYIHAPRLYWHTFQHTFLSKLSKDTKRGGIPVDTLLENAGVCLKDFPDLVTKPFGSMWTYSPSHFHAHQTDFLDWMQTYAPYFGNDELTAICYQQLFDIQIRSLSKMLKLTMNHTPRYLSTPDTGTQILHGLFSHATEAAFQKLLQV